MAIQDLNGFAEQVKPRATCKKLDAPKILVPANTAVSQNGRQQTNPNQVNRYANINGSTIERHMAAFLTKNHKTKLIA